MLSADLALRSISIRRPSDVKRDKVVPAVALHFNWQRRTLPLMVFLLSAIEWRLTMAAFTSYSALREWDCEGQAELEGKLL